MSGKTSYAILISFMTLFALAAQAKDVAFAEKSELLSSVGNQSKYEAALMKYSQALDRAYTPKPKKIAKEETRLPDDSKGMIQRRPAKGRPIGTPFAIGKPLKPAPKDAVMAQLDSQVQGLYADCLKAGPKECCEPLIDKRAPMPASCGGRSIASDSAGPNDQPVAPSAETASNAMVSTSSSSAF